MSVPRMIDLVKGQKVHFQYYKDNELWYATDSGFTFLVPFDKTRPAASELVHELKHEVHTDVPRGDGS